MRLTIHNYGILDDVDIELEPGLTTLSGKNGSGKSTVVDALFFAITGEPLDGRNVTELVNWEALDGKAVVELSCESFTLTRTIKNGLAHKLKLSDGTVFTKKVDVNDWLFNHYKITNSGVLREVFFSAQLHATDLFDTTNAVRLTMLSKMFGLDNLEQCRTIIYRVLAETPIPQVNDDLIQQLETRIQEVRRNVEDTTNSCKELETKRSALAFEPEEYLKIRNAPTDVERQTHEAALKEAIQKHADASAICSELSGKFDKFQKLQAMRERYALIQHVQTLTETLDSLSGGVSLDKLLEARRNIYKESAILEQSISELKQRGGDSSECPLTHSKPCIEYIRLHDPQLVAAEIEEKQGLLKSIQDDCNQLEELVTEAQDREKRCSDIRKELETVGDLTSPDLSEEQVNTDLEALGDFDALQTSYRTASEHVKIWEGEVSKQRTWLEQFSACGSVTEEVKRSWDDLKAEFDKLSVQLETLQQVAATHQQTLNHDQQLLKQLQDDRAKAQDIGRRIEVLKDVRDLLSRENLQRALMQRALHRVNKEIEVASKIFNFKYRVFITEQGDIVFQDDNIDPKDVRFLSGGQKYTAAIITRIAFARVLNTNFDFMVLDEPSICLDDNSREMLAELLTALNQRFSTERKVLLVPTHDELLLSIGSNFIVGGD